MSKPSDTPEDWGAQREKIIGLGERSLRKTYYPELQQKLEELERFRALLDQSNDCIFLIYCPSLTFADVNESACRQLGCSRQEFVSFPIERFLPGDAVARILELVASKTTNEKSKATITTSLYKCTGEELPVEITIRLVTFHKTLYGVAVARDITERIRAEQAMLENSRIVRDMELARQIQLSLLPPAPPDLPGVRLSACCVPAAHVGGDYYDYYRRDGIIDLVIADVSGHSIGAALMMAEMRSFLHAEVYRFSSTGNVLASLNNTLYEDLTQAELFITMFYAKYDISSRLLTFSNAGHVLPLLSRRPHEACHRLDAEGLILGVRKEVIFEENQVQMQPGDILTLYTDGITEARNPSGELFGLARLCRLLASLHSESPQAIIDAVLVEISAFSGTTVIEDDVTMIVMKLE